MAEFYRKIPLVPTAEDFKYRDISPAELPHVMRRHILTGAMGSTYGTLTTGMFLVAFGDIIGVSIVEWGILGAVSCFAIAVQLASAYWASTIGYRRLLWYVAEVSNRLLRALALGLALLLYHFGYGTAAASLLVCLFCVAAFFAAAAQPPWYSWLADIIPEKIQGTFMGRRDAWISLATISVVLPASYCLDLAGEDFKGNILAIIFVLGILLGMVDLFMHRVIPEPPAAREPNGSFFGQVLAPLRDREYRPWLVFTSCWSFAVYLGGSLAIVFFIENLDIRRNLLGGSVVLVGVPLIATMLTSWWSGALIDRLGVRKVLVVCHFIWSTLPLYWIVASPRTALLWLGISSALGGGATSPAVNAANKLIIRVPPPEQRAMYLAVTACLNNLAGGMGPLAAGLFLDLFEGRHWLLGGFEVVPFHLVFAASFVLRLASWLLVFRIKKPAFDNGIPG